MDFRQAFGERLRERRISQGYDKQDEFGKVIGVSVQTISGYEKGDRVPNAEVIAKMAIALNCTADYLTLKDDAPTHEAENIADRLCLSPAAIGELLEPIGQIEKAIEKDNRAFLDDEQKKEACERFRRTLETLIVSGMWYPIAESAEIFFAAKCKAHEATQKSMYGLVDFFDKYGATNRANYDGYDEAVDLVGELAKASKDADYIMHGAKQKALDAFTKFLDAFEVGENGEH